MLPNRSFTCLIYQDLVRHLLAELSISPSLITAAVTSRVICHSIGCFIWLSELKYRIVAYAFFFAAAADFWCLTTTKALNF